MVPAVERAFQILELIGTSTQPLRTSEVSTRLGLPRSGTYDLVNTLKALGAVNQRPDGQLAIGPTLFVLGGAYAHSLDLPRIATAVAEEVMAECEETVQVAALDGRHVVYIAMAESPHPLRLVSAVGRRLPAHCTALGKMQLALLPPDELAKRLHGIVLEKLTEDSITDPDELERELTHIRECGSAFDNCESNPGVVCVAAPVWDARGQNVVGMSISVPAIRLDVARCYALRDLVVRGASELSHRLGYSAAGGGKPTTGLPSRRHDLRDADGCTRYRQNARS